MQFASQYVNLSTGLLQKHHSSTATSLVKKQNLTLDPSVSLSFKTTKIFLPLEDIY